MSKEEKAIATRADWKTTDMPEKNSTFILSREFSAEQIAALRHGNIPKEMEDNEWQGENLMGFALMEARDILRECKQNRTE